MNTFLYGLLAGITIASVCACAIGYGYKRKYERFLAVLASPVVKPLPYNPVGPKVKALLANMTDEWARSGREIQAIFDKEKQNGEHERNTPAAS